MKTIRLKICGYGTKNPTSYANFIVERLHKYYKVEFSENPDYLIYHESTFEHLKYNNCIKIFFTGENITPNFNLCDYSIGFDYLNFEDRHYRYPLYLIKVFYNDAELELVNKNYLYEPLHLTKEDLATKKEFCSFVYSNYRSDNHRKLIVEKLSEYKTVNCGGSYLNNTHTKIANKVAFEMGHKFSIAFENSSRSGYTTEKIVSAIAAKTIPIYWGNPNIAKEFNSKRFINCHDYKNFDEVLERVKQIDANDELYLNMVNAPIAADGYSFTQVQDEFDTFLKNIFDQPLERAKRRTINPTRALDFERYETITSIYVSLKSLMFRCMVTLYKPFKKSRYIEKLKHTLFKI